MFEENRIYENKKFQENKNSSRESLKDFSNDELISQTSSFSPPKNVGIILPFDKAYENISKSIINGITEAYYSSPRFMANTKLFFYPSNMRNFNQIPNRVRKDEIDFLIGPLRKENFSKIMDQISDDIDVFKS